jgi:uncharacterized protein YdgA (DUF945 family)
MKKIIAVLVAAGVIGFPAATWFYGSRAQASAEQFSSAITQAVPYISVASNEYSKGFLNSTQTIRLRPSLPAVGDKAWPEIVIENKIDHGPFPGFKGVGAARITHNIVWPAEVKAELAKLWGQQEPLTMVTQMGLGGGGSTTFSSPAANAKIDKANVAFKGLNGVMNFTSGFANIDYTLEAPGATIEDAENKLVIGKIGSSGTHAKLAGTEKIYTGKQTATFESLDMVAKGQPAATIKNVAYVVDTSAPETNLLSATGKLTGASLKFANFDLGALDYSYSLSKLHAPSVEAITKAIQAEVNKVADSAAAGGSKNAAAVAKGSNDAMMNAIKQHLPELSKHVPKFNIDKIRVGNAKDYAQLDGSMFLKPVSAQEAANPMTIIPKIDASINVELSDSWLSLIAAQGTQRMMGDQSAMLAQLPPEQRAQAEAQSAAQAKFMIDQQLGALVEQGYIVRGVGKVSAQIALKEGKLTVNGKPVGQGLLPSK